MSLRAVFVSLPLWVSACAGGSTPGPEAPPVVPDDLPVDTTEDAPPAPDTPTPAPECVADAACDDGDPCNGEETCDADGTCKAGVSVSCGAGETCTIEEGGAVCAVLCALPLAPVTAELADDELLTFRHAPDDAVSTAILAPGDDPAAAVFLPGDTVSVSGLRGPVRVLARTDNPACGASDVFDHTWQVYPAYPGAAGTRGSPAVPLTAPAAWATGVDSVHYGSDVSAPWQTPSAALGPAEGRSDAVCALGEGGEITLTFDPPLVDGPGADLAVFENAFDDGFLELAFVEVSSDGHHFLRFDSAFRSDDGAIGAFGLTDPTALTGLAGKFRQGWGAPFDLSWLRFEPDARAGRVDLSAIRYVKVVDVLGDGGDVDSFGRAIYDPFPTVGSAGFDLDAIGALHAPVTP
jgi:hypothetical protein